MHRLTQRVISSRANALLAASLVFAVILWGASNAATKHLVSQWPAIWTGGTRFICAGLLMMGILRVTTMFGPTRAISPQLSKGLWLRGGLSLAAYIVLFNLSFSYIPVAHVVLYLGASPVWALLWEGRPGNMRVAVQRYGAALLALAGVLVLLWPALHHSAVHLYGELLGLTASVLWTSYGRQCRLLTRELGGAQVSAQTMWRAGVLLIPFMIWEGGPQMETLTAGNAAIQAYCIIGGGVMAYGIWSIALRRWSTSKVYLFNNLIPISSMTWAHFTLGEAVTSTFWIAMALIVTGVVIGQWSPGKVESQKAATVVG